MKTAGRCSHSRHDAPRQRFQLAPGSRLGQRDPETAHSRSRARRRRLTRPHFVAATAPSALSTILLSLLTLIDAVMVSLLACATSCSTYSALQVVCQYFLRGTCRFGNACRNEHPRDGQKQGSAFGSAFLFVPNRPYLFPQATPDQSWTPANPAPAPQAASSTSTATLFTFAHLPIPNNAQSDGPPRFSPWPPSASTPSSEI